MNRILYGERWANQHFASETLGFYAILILLLAVRVSLHARAALLRFLDGDDIAGGFIVSIYFHVFISDSLITR